MEGPAEVNEGIRRAVALMTEWNESEDSDAWFAVQLASQDLAVAVVSDRLLDESITLVTGFMSLAGRLLTELERQTQTPIPTLLQRAGAEAVE
jgi:hypothetical protein